MLWYVVQTLTIGICALDKIFNGNLLLQLVKTMPISDNKASSYLVKRQTIQQKNLFREQVFSLYKIPLWYKHYLDLKKTIFVRYL